MQEKTIRLIKYLVLISLLGAGIFTKNIIFLLYGVVVHFGFEAYLSGKFDKKSRK